MAETCTVGVIADVHGNQRALAATIDAMITKGCTMFFLLGDYVSDTAGNRETMDMLYELREHFPCYALRGNREEYLISHRRVLRGEAEGPEWLANSASGNLLYAYGQMTEQDLDWFEALPITFRFEQEGLPAITCCHGSPTNTRELLQLTEEPVQKVLAALDTDYLIAGHTHHQGVAVHAGKTYVNTGSCGLSIDDQGYAHSVILHGEAGKWTPELLRVRFDVNAVISDLFTSGLYEMAPWFMNNNIHILLRGIDRTSEMVVRAMELSKEKGQKEGNAEHFQWPFIPEECFEQAASQVGIKDYSYMRGLRVAKCSDMEKVLAHYHSLISGASLWSEDYPNRETAEFDISRNSLFLMENSEGEVIGTVSIDDDPDVCALPFWNPLLEPVGELSRLGVRKDLHGKGIGRMLMAYAINELRNRGFSGVHILVVPNHEVALRSYEVFGYCKAGECELFGHQYACFEKEL